MNFNPLTLVPRMCCQHVLSWIIVLVIVCLFLVTNTAYGLEQAQIDRMIEVLNPAQYDEDGTDITKYGPFVGESVTTISEKVKAGTWYSFLVFLPFLVLPLALLLIIVFKFRAGVRKGQAPATFTHNVKLEIVWTAIPVLALLIVAVPITRLLDYQESPPEVLTQEAIDRGDVFSVEVIGRQFNWLYKYPTEHINVGSFVLRDLPTPRIIAEAGHPQERLTAVQEAVVFRRDDIVNLFLQATDVNHAWWVPAFAVKKDTLTDRPTHTWFKPSKRGFYEGACSELCGADHSIMKIVASVLDPEEYTLWVDFKRHEDDALAVVAGLREGEGEKAFAAYVAKDSSPESLAALKFWFGYDKAIHASIWSLAAESRFAAFGGGVDGYDEFKQRQKDRSNTFSALIESFSGIEEVNEEEVIPAEGNDV